MVCTILDVVETAGRMQVCCGFQQQDGQLPKTPSSVQMDTDQRESFQRMCSGCRAPSLRMLRRLKAWHLMEGKANGYKSKDGALLAMESGAPVSPAWGGEGLQAWVGHDLTVLSAWDWSSVQC